MNRPGTGSQSIRGMPMYSQSGNPQRGAPIASSRLTNGKMSGGSGWPFAMASFAQTIGGGQPAAPLDPSEFPSLSAAPQQHQNPGQTWAVSGQRNAASPIPPGGQRLQGSSAIGGSQSEELGHFGTSNDAFRFGQGTQSRTGQTDDFPPLGANGQDSASALNGTLFGGLATSNLSMRKGVFSSMPESRNPSEQVAAALESKATLNGSSSQREQSSLEQDPIHSSRFAEDGEHAQSEPNALERFGLSGLLNMVRSEQSDQAGLAIGQDLTQLGLDLNSPENQPLYQTFGSPWADPAAKLLDPEFTLPSCYTVTNVNPVVEKLQSFTDETLFYMFYTMPRQQMQEKVAAELMSRNWRYHKEFKLWLTKDGQSQSKQIGPESEFGTYMIFDATSWKRERKEMVLEYAMLDSGNRDLLA